MAIWSDLVTFPIQIASLYRLRPFCTPLSTFFCPLVDLFSVDFSRSQSEALKKPTFSRRPALKCFEITYRLFNSTAISKIYSISHSIQSCRRGGRTKIEKMPFWWGRTDHPGSLEQNFWHKCIRRRTSIWPAPRTSRSLGRVEVSLWC